MNRFGAFLIHLGISLVIFAVLAYLVLYVWYPDFFFASDGGWQGMRIIVFVDLVLGPTLTLVVFNRNKPVRELKRDLSIIAAIQFCSLVAGVFVVFESRPIALVYVDGKFYSMTSAAYEELGTEPPDLSEFPGPWPKRVLVELPKDLSEVSELRLQALQAGVPLRALTGRYQTMTFEGLNAADEAYSTKELKSRLKDPSVLQEWLETHGGTPKDYAFFDYATRYGYAILGVSTESGEILGLLTDPAPA